MRGKYDFEAPFICYLQNILSLVVDIETSRCPRLGIWQTYFSIWSVDFEDHEDQNPKRNESKAPTWLFTLHYLFEMPKRVLYQTKNVCLNFQNERMYPSLLKRHYKLIDTASTQFLLAKTRNLHIITYLQYKFLRHYNPQRISPATPARASAA